MRKAIGVGICAMALGLFAAWPAAALAEEAHSYEQLSPNGKYVFVMLTKSPDSGGKVDTLKQKYPHSGLYRTGKPQKALWRVNWYSSRVHISSDGIHLIRIGRAHVSSVNNKPDMAQLAIAFYKNGKLIRTQLIKDLLGNPKSLIGSPAGFVWASRIAFNDESGSIDVTLVTGQNKVFDMKSGNIIGSTPAPHKKEK